MTKFVWLLMTFYFIQFFLPWAFQGGSLLGLQKIPNRQKDHPLLVGSKMADVELILKYKIH